MNAACTGTATMNYANGECIDLKRIMSSKALSSTPWYHARLKSERNASSRLRKLDLRYSTDQRED
jgi:hypothetical protein